MIWDHAVVIVLLVVVPIGGWYSYRQLRTQSPLDERARMGWYTRVIAQQWALLAGVAALWLASGRTLAQLGLVLPGDLRSLLGLVLTMGGLGLLLVQWRSFAAASHEDREGIRAQLVGTEALVPRTEREHGRFRLVAVTAGICEELLFRGYLITYLAFFVGGWIGLTLAAGLFGLAHVYQGPAGAVKTGTVGLVMGLIFVLTGSVLWGMVLHIATDLQGAAIGRRVLSEMPGLSEGAAADG